MTVTVKVVPGADAPTPRPFGQVLFEVGEFRVRYAQGTDAHRPKPYQVVTAGGVLISAHSSLARARVRARAAYAADQASKATVDTSEPAPYLCIGCGTDHEVVVEQIEVGIRGVVSTYVDLVGICRACRVHVNDQPSELVNRHERDKVIRRREALRKTIQKAVWAQAEAMFVWKAAGR